MKRLLFILGVFGLAACSQNAETEIKAPITQPEHRVVLTEKQHQNAQIKTGTLKAMNLPMTIQLQGEIEAPPQNILRIASPLGGLIRFEELLPGTFVKKGQILARLQDPQYIQLQKEYYTAKSGESLLYKDFVRQKELFEAGASSEKVMQIAKARYEEQQYEVKAIQQKCNTLHIPLNGKMSSEVPLIAPSDAFINAVMVSNGSMVSAQESLFELIHPNDMHLTLHVFEKDLPMIRIGEKVKAYSNQDTTQFIHGEVILIGQSVGMDKRVEVHCHLNPYHEKLLPGMYMNAEIHTTQQSGNFLPEDAVVRFEGKEYVFIRSGPLQYDMTEVSTGNIYNGYIQVTHPGWNGTEEIVTQSAYTLLMALKNTDEE